jgi:NTP-dependent ternary system trypsin peptidase co-occuring protein
MTLSGSSSVNWTKTARQTTFCIRIVVNGTQNRNPQSQSCRKQIHECRGNRLGGEEDISFRLPEFREVMDSIEQIAATLSEMMKRVKPSKAAVEFGIEIAAESGGLTALLVKGTGKANLVLKLEWV